MIMDTEKLKELRKKENLTQEKLASMAGISQNHLSQIETGKCMPALDTAVSIAKALNATVNDLLVDHTKSNPPPPSPPKSKTQKPPTAKRARGKRAVA